jgi:hypothetical protein
LLHRYLADLAPATTPFHRIFESTARFFSLLRNDSSHHQQRCVMFPELALALRQGKVR